MEPWGFHVEEVRYGTVVASIFKSQGAKHVTPEQFMYEPEDRHAPTPQVFAEQLKLALGATEVEGG